VQMRGRTLRIDFGKDSKAIPTIELTDEVKQKQKNYQVFRTIFICAFPILAE